MHLVSIGLSHDVAPIALRERVAFVGRDAADALCDLASSENLGEAAILSTCNRTEVYAVTEAAEAAKASLAGMISRRCGLTRGEVDAAFVWREGDEVVSHLFRVAAGLESQILGEGQILGQVREAAKLAREAGALGPLLDALFRHVVAAGKRVRSETGISQGSVSIGSAAVELAKDTLEGLTGRTTLLVGAGKLGELALKHLAAQGVNRIVVANRTLESASELARVVGGEAIPFIGMQPSLREADVVLCCTGAPHYVLSKADIEAVMTDRPGRTLVVVDVSVPRNIDPAVAEVPGVRLFDIDHLTAVAERNRDERAFLVPRVEGVLAEEMAEWHRFMRSYQAAPTIAGLRQKVESLREQEFEAFVKEMATVLTPEEIAAVEKLTRSLAAKFLHEPTIGLRDRGDGQHAVHAAAIRELFGIGTAALRRERRIGTTGRLR
jgi:glutamyl-tRNA reductase